MGKEDRQKRYTQGLRLSQYGGLSSEVKIKRFKRQEKRILGAELDKGSSQNKLVKI